MPINWRQIIPTLFTLAAMLCGFFSILLALEGKAALEGNASYLLSAQFIMVAGMFYLVLGPLYMQAAKSRAARSCPASGRLQEVRVA